MELSDLLPLLRKHGVIKFKTADSEIEFEPQPVELKSPAQVVEVPLPANMPQELRNPEAMSADTILNWSAAPEGKQEAPLPLTGDAPLSGGEP